MWSSSKEKEKVNIRMSSIILSTKMVTKSLISTSKTINVTAIALSTRLPLIPGWGLGKGKFKFKINLDLKLFKWKFKIL